MSILTTRVHFWGFLRVTRVHFTLCVLCSLAVLRVTLGKLFWTHSIVVCEVCRLTVHWVDCWVVTKELIVGVSCLVCSVWSFELSPCNTHTHQHSYSQPIKYSNALQHISAFPNDTSVLTTRRSKCQPRIQSSTDQHKHKTRCTSHQSTT